MLRELEPVLVITIIMNMRVTPMTMITIMDIIPIPMRITL
jgi:hypothetical protein